VNLVFSMWESESESASAHKYGGGLLTSSNHGVKTEGFVQRGNSWYVRCIIITEPFEVVTILVNRNCRTQTEHKIGSSASIVCTISLSILCLEQASFIDRA